MIADDQRHPVDLLADEFADRLRAGDSVSIEDYAARHPELADLIRAVFPPIEAIERARNQQDSRRLRSGTASIVEPLTAAPQRLGDFHVVREIGRGGMGIVYEAEQESLKRRVALKVMGGVSSDEGGRRERFRREAEAAAGLHHTNIVGVFGIGEENGVLYYAMQLIRGVPLSKAIQNLRRGSVTQVTPNAGLDASKVDALLAMISGLALGEEKTTGTVDPTAAIPSAAIASAAIASVASEEGNHQEVETGFKPDTRIMLGANYFRFVAQIIASAASGLQYAHHAGILHRDIKPSNLMLDHEGTLWITDFGVAKRESLEDMTQTGEIVGTLRYMAPEQLQGKSDHRSDIYSLGLTLIELLTLSPAITSATGKWFEATARGCVQSPRSIRKEIPKDLEVIAMKAAAVDPEARYASAGSLENDLRRFLEDRPILAKRESLASKLRRSVRRNPAVSMLTAASLILLSVIAVMFAIGNLQKQAALEEIAKQFQRAETNLEEKTIALRTADRERQRAETNLSMAIEAFENVITNIGSRGGVEALLDDLGDDEAIVAVADAGLSEADVQLLENLLEFFDRFAVENETDLSLEAATAKRRLGDIYQRLGRFEEADNAYQWALDSYRAIRNSQASQDGAWDAPLVKEIEIINELMTVAASRGRAGEVVDHYELAKEMVAATRDFLGSAEGQFAYAKLNSTMAALGSRFGKQNRSRFAQLWSRRNPTGRIWEAISGQVPQLKLAREQNANSVAIELLEGLLGDAPDNVAYRINLARAEREEIRLAQGGGDRQRAKDSQQRSAELMEALCSQYPESLAFKYELALTLRAGLHVGPQDAREYQRAIRTCDELVQADPESVDYRALRSSVHTRAAAIAFSAGRRAQAIDLLKLAIDDQRYLLTRFPEVPVYRLAATQSMSNLANALSGEGRYAEARLVLDEAIELLASGRLKNRAATLLQRLETRRESLPQE